MLTTGIYIYENTSIEHCFRNSYQRHYKRKVFLMDHHLIYYRNLTTINPNDIYFTDMGKGKVSKISGHVLAPYLDTLVQSEDPSLPQPHKSPYETTSLEFLNLFKNIKTQGYNPKYPVQVAIDPLGRAIVCDGIHRTLVCRKLGITSMPCLILYRSIEWWLFRSALYNQHSNTTKLYQKVNHFDFNLWTSWRVDCDIRAELIYNDVIKFHAEPKSLVGAEIACNTGTISCALARKGVTMRGFDTDPKCINSASRLAQMDAIGARFESNEGTSILASFELCGQVIDPNKLPDCDFIICLSLLNHFQIDERRTEAGLNIFRNLAMKTNRIYLDCPVDRDAVGGGTEFTQPQKVFEWCASAGIGGHGRIVAEIESNKPLMRPLLVWEF